MPKANVKSNVVEKDLAKIMSLLEGVMKKLHHANQAAAPEHKAKAKVVHAKITKVKKTAPVKTGRGRPAAKKSSTAHAPASSSATRGRGRPRKAA